MGSLEIIVRCSLSVRLLMMTALPSGYMHLRRASWSMKLSSRCFHADSPGFTYLMIQWARKLWTWVFQSMVLSPPFLHGPMVVAPFTHLRMRLVFLWACWLEFGTVISGSRDHHKMSASFCTVLIISLDIGREYSQYLSRPKYIPCTIKTPFPRRSFGKDLAFCARHRRPVWPPVTPPWLLELHMR